MDLEEFEGSNQTLTIPSSVFEYARIALDTLDRMWFINATRMARWMDLLGDYAGGEPFIIDGKLNLHENYFEYSIETNFRRSDLSDSSGQSPACNRAEVG